ncbi:M28 family metallopeptidase [Maribacter sp. 2307ULW6-5]|uniref:M28 family metallopeptidase n=1 Tax=Maribacter sp. 2307ULW6-5 TaxID=3386275 RepID=UPI0039BC65C4
MKSMKTFLLLSFAVFALSCKGPQKATGANAQNSGAATAAQDATATTERNAGAKMDSFGNAQRIKGMMQFLASDGLKGRDSGSKGLEAAASYASGIFRESGVSPFFETYNDTLDNFEGTTYNVVGVLPGNDPELAGEYVVIGAHYDHIGQIAAKNGDSIANGANDNASGSITVLELARYFGAAKTNKRSMIFALFSAEEKGLLGSRHLARKLKERDLDLYVMLNFEMVGVPMADKDHLLYLTGHELSNMASVANELAGEKVVGFLPKAKEFNLFKRSDNYPFHEVFGVPSQTFCSFDFTNYDHYHQVGDEAALMDYGHMATVVNKLLPAVEGIVNDQQRTISYR